MRTPVSEESPTPDEVAFRGVMGRFATGVTVMTALADGVPHGMTANAVSSVSLEPRLVLVCVERTTVMAERVERAGAFALNVLGAGQDGISNRFADGDRPDGDPQFAGLEVASAVTGSPILAEAMAWLDCRVWASYDGGDHVIVVGEVVDLAEVSDASPLLFYRGGYRRLAG
jgi:flavin reductase